MLKNYIDHHIHTKYSWDGQISYEELVKFIREIGLQGAVITDHIEFRSSDRGYGFYQYEEAFEEYSILKEKVLDLKIKFGAEISHDQKKLKVIKDYLHKRNFHFVIGSNHNVQWEEISDFILRKEREGDDFKESLNDYFKETLKLVESNLYDCLGHLDFPKRFMKKKLKGEFFLKYYGKIIEDILVATLDHGIFIEVNTAPFRVEFNEPYPGWAILKKYRELGGREVILSSDAHRVEDIGTAFEAVIKELHRIGLNIRNGV